MFNPLVLHLCKEVQPRSTPWCAQLYLQPSRYPFVQRSTTMVGTLVQLALCSTQSFSIFTKKKTTIGHSATSCMFTQSFSICVKKNNEGMNRAQLAACSICSFIICAKKYNRGQDHRATSWLFDLVFLHLCQEVQPWSDHSTSMCIPLCVLSTAVCKTNT
jgi:hypothetical protein